MSSGSIRWIAWEGRILGGRATRGLLFHKLVIDVLTELVDLLEAQDVMVGVEESNAAIHQAMIAEPAKANAVQSFIAQQSAEYSLLGQPLGVVLGDLLRSALDPLDRDSSAQTVSVLDRAG